MKLSVSAAAGFCAVVTMTWSGATLQAAENEYQKVGAWKVIAVTNNDGTLNRCLAHLPGAQGFLRIHMAPNGKWALSVPGNSPQLPLRPNTKVWSEVVMFGPGGSMNATNWTFTVDASAGRASSAVSADDLKQLRTATNISIKLFNRPEPCDADKKCPEKTYEWNAKDIGKALGMLPACIKAN